MAAVAVVFVFFNNFYLCGVGPAQEGQDAAVTLEVVAAHVQLLQVQQGVQHSHVDVAQLVV